MASAVVPDTQVPCDVKKYPAAHELQTADVAAVIADAVEHAAQLAVTLVHSVHVEETSTYPEMHVKWTVAELQVAAPVEQAVQADDPA